MATENYVTTRGYITSSSLTGLATENYVETAISNLIDTAPTTLNTLNELAAALGDDANFATTVTTALGTKAPINNPTFTGTVSGITATMVGLGNVANISAVDLLTNTILEGTTQLQAATFTGTVTMQQSVEKFVTASVVAGAVALNFNQAAIFVVTPDISNFTADFLNIPGTAGRTITTTLIITQGSTPYIPNIVRINGGGNITPQWLGGIEPTGTPTQIEIVSFTFVCTATNTWTVLGSLSTYG